MCFAPQRRAIVPHPNFQKVVVCFVHFDLKMCSVPQRSAIFHFSSTPRACPLTLPTHKSLETHNVLRVSYHFAHVYLLFSDSFSLLRFFTALLFFAFYLSVLSEV